MNDQIQELAKQAEARYRANVLGASMYKTPPDRLMKMFAELIIEEIHDFIMEESANDNGIPGLGKVKQHFGV